MSISPAKREQQTFLEAYADFEHADWDCLGNVIGLIPTPDWAPFYQPEGPTPAGAETFATTGVDGLHYCITAQDEALTFHLVVPGEDKCYVVGRTMAEFLSYALSVIGCVDTAFEGDREEFIDVVEGAREELAEPLSSPSCRRDIERLRSAYPIEDLTPGEVYDRLIALNA